MSKEPSPSYVDPKGEFPFDAPTYLFHLFVVIARYRDAALDAALKPLGLNVSRHRALSVIARMQPCAMSDLAQFSAVDRTTMTRTVDQLVRAGLVDRVTPAKDRRQVILSLTREGAQLYRRSLRLIFETNQKLLAGVPHPQRRAAIRVYEAIVANLVEDPGLADRRMYPATDGKP
jgi:DNA-binding MarR family transcriptional regulator